MRQHYRRSLAAGALVVLACAAAGRARADEKTTASLSWVRLPGAEACISSQELSRRVEARLGRSLLVPPSAAGLPIEARIEPTSTGWQATIETMDPDGRRRGTRVLVHEGADCRAFDGKLELVIAVTIDPEAELGAAPARPKPAALAKPPPSPPVKPCAPARCPARAPMPEREPWTGAVLGSAVVGIGLLPGVAFGARAALKLKPPGLIPIELGGTAWLERSETTSAGGAEASRFTAHLQLCPSHRLSGAVTLGACGGVEAGVVRGSGFDFDQDKRENVAAVSVIAGPELRVDLTARLFGFAAASVHLPVVRPRLYYRAADGSEQEVYQASALAGSAGLGLGLAF